MVEYLKVENRVLRDRLPRTIRVTPQEKNLIRQAGKKLGSALNGLITIVSPRTFARWVNGDKPKDKPTPTRKPGRLRAGFPWDVPWPRKWW